MIGEAFARLSTGLKMLLILSAALLPLGIIAVVASMQATQAARATSQVEARAMLSVGAQLLETRIAEDADALHAAAARVAGASDCGAALASLAARLSLAMVTRSGERICALGATAPIDRTMLAVRDGIQVSLTPDSSRLRFAVALGGGRVAVGEYAAAEVRHAVRPVLVNHYVLRVRHDADMLVLGGGKPGAAAVAGAIAEPLASGPAQIELLAARPPISAVELLTAVLPILMWLAAAIIGWLVVDRLLLSPLGQMQRAIAGYRAGAGPLELPALTTPALEIRALGDAFRQVTEQLTGHEAELEQGLARQIRLTREVHHRVKNNLQVVSSLINLHARGVHDPAVINAYASIQRRVDALAVVHRNHFAELEENRGVRLRALIGELAANLRATAPAGAAHLAITLDVMPAYASQDVAVPVSFLITEIVELAMDCDPKGRIAILLAPTDRPERGLLTIVAPGLASEACGSHPSTDRYLRVTEGLSRQLRSKLHRDGDGQRISIEIAINLDDGSE